MRVRTYEDCPRLLTQADAEQIHQARCKLKGLPFSPAQLPQSSGAGNDGIPPMGLFPPPPPPVTNQSSEYQPTPTDGEAPGRDDASQSGGDSTISDAIGDNDGNSSDIPENGEKGLGN